MQFRFLCELVKVSLRNFPVHLKKEIVNIFFSLLANRTSIVGWKKSPLGDTKSKGISFFFFFIEDDTHQIFVFLSGVTRSVSRL